MVKRQKGNYTEKLKSETYKGYKIDFIRYLEKYGWNIDYSAKHKSNKTLLGGGHQTKSSALSRVKLEIDRELNNNLQNNDEVEFTLRVSGHNINIYINGLYEKDVSDDFELSDSDETTIKNFISEGYVEGQFETSYVGKDGLYINWSIE